MTQREIKLFQEKILSWYKLHKRDLPWRNAHDPYKILVSEVMSQQTQISRVVPKYENWLVYFPDVASLAKAGQPDVLRQWSGLGYNRRALALQKAAKEIVEKHKGVFPEDIANLQTLPGIGIYTASAIACFAFNAQIPVIDTNVRKVIAHELLGGLLPDEKEILKIAKKILPKGMAYDWNQALMDYAGAVLKDKKIPVARQSDFKSSDRYYRGAIIKVLLEVSQMSFIGFYDYFNERNPIDSSRLEKIVKKMEKEELILRRNDVFSLLGGVA